jgi:hypothetical protein
MAGAIVDWPLEVPSPLATELPAAGHIGLVLTLQPVGDDKIRLRVDEVTRAGSGWIFNCLSTHVDYDRDAVLNLQLSQEQFAEIGFNLLLTLTVHHKQKR